MKENARKLVRIRALFIVVISVILVHATGASAADSTVKIYIGDSTAARHHLNLAVDAVSDEFSFEVKGYEVKSSEYVSGSPSVFRISDASGGKCKVKAVAEGTGTLTLTIKTTDGHTLKEVVFVSVFKRVESCQGSVKKNNAPVYRCAATNTGVENEDKKGELPAKTAVQLVGVCNDFYFVKLKEEVDFVEGSLYNFIKKSDISVPVTKIIVNDNIIMQVGKLERLNVNVYPTIASDTGISYQSDNKKVAKISETGIITSLKAGSAVIKVKSLSENVSVSCKVTVIADLNTAWKQQNNNKPPTTNSGVEKSKGVKLKAKGDTDSSIKLTWGKQKGSKYIKVQRTSKKKGKFKTIAKVGKNKRKYRDKKIKFYKKYRYRLLIVGKNGKKKYSNIVTGRSKDTTVDFNFRITSETANSITLKWDKQKHAKRYVIMRKAEGESRYKTIKTVSKKTHSFINKNLEEYTNYYYKICIIKTNKKQKSSKAIQGKTKYFIDKESNIKFFNDKYPFVCTDPTKDMNTYSVFDNFYSPIKYKYNGETLEVHLYLEFATYEGDPDSGYTKQAASRESKIKGLSFVDLYMQGVRENYRVDIVKEEYEFQGVNFNVDIIFHEKGTEEFNGGQQFNEILIGGECPYCSSKGDHWYHEHEAYTWAEDKWEYFQYARIYLPYSEQLLDNNEEGYRTPFSFEQLKYVTAHETGHTLGLWDGYTKDNHDRFTDNDETGILSNNGYQYDNLMVQEDWNKPIIANDLEMMFAAYANNQGRPWKVLETYKTSDYFNTVISSCINNKVDLYIDEK